MEGHDETGIDGVAFKNLQLNSKSGRLDVSNGLAANQPQSPQVEKFSTSQPLNTQQRINSRSSMASNDVFQGHRPTLSQQVSSTSELMRRLVSHNSHSVEGHANSSFNSSSSANAIPPVPSVPSVKPLNSSSIPQTPNGFGYRNRSREKVGVSSSHTSISNTNVSEVSAAAYRGSVVSATPQPSHDGGFPARSFVQTPVATPTVTNDMGASLRGFGSPLSPRVARFESSLTAVPSSPLLTNQTDAERQLMEVMEAAKQQVDTDMLLVLLERVVVSTMSLYNTAERSEPVDALAVYLADFIRQYTKRQTHAQAQTANIQTNAPVTESFSEHRAAPSHSRTASTLEQSNGFTSQQQSATRQDPAQANTSGSGHIQDTVSRLRAQFQTPPRHV